MKSNEIIFLVARNTCNRKNKELFTFEIKETSRITRHHKISNRENLHSPNKILKN